MRKPIEKVKAKGKLLTKIVEALKEADAAGVSDPASLIEKALHYRRRYQAWKLSKKR